ncbi:MAG TPA: group III truncated hemoglobin [Acidocella sp.]|jgi:hemoglobin|uniref:group III truncated hemoglobin n=1 Tax=Acidocella sp. TaxID=50710 RepID=UPI002C399F3A|nr:group III truncated hemoglobin [Acidocella sp.]HVE22275.1 group III truncated hemoglobin [Acidocella sp.]
MQMIEGLDEALLSHLVSQFYAEVRADALLGPLFNRAIVDWPAHLERLSAFWSSVMLTTGRYKGQPLPAHLRHQAEITPEMFARWLALWEGNALQCLPPDAAAAVIAKAHRIADSLQMGLFPLIPPSVPPRAPGPLGAR